MSYCPIREGNHNSTKKHILHKRQHGLSVNRLLIHIKQIGTNQSAPGAYYVRNSCQFLRNRVIFPQHFLDRNRARPFRSVTDFVYTDFVLLKLMIQKCYCVHNHVCCMNKKRTILSRFKCRVV